MRTGTACLSCQIGSSATCSPRHNPRKSPQRSEFPEYTRGATLQGLGSQMYQGRSEVVGVAAT